MSVENQHQPAERIARWVFLALIVLTAIVFGAFYLIGFNRPYADDPNFNAPLLTNVLRAARDRGRELADIARGEG